ncbi:MAG: 3-phosphoshikimate 1-carboxyvinyltransferase, partial [Anaerolineae bacterium]|nr:3-phosphoshikimate 1-carboxyvinyltransferase [Anaerolineae bacterium]
MTLTVYPSTKLHGEISLPGDKSISHRAALFAALAQGESKVNNFLVSGVTSVMLENLELLGISYQLENTTLSIRSQGIHQLHPPKSTLDCGNSATTMRLLAGLLAAAGLPASLDGSPSLRLRPMSRIIDPLRLMGVPISGNSKGHAPLILHHRPPNQKLQPLMFNLPVASAQVKTTLILAALGAEDVSTLSEPFVSRDHTERMLARMGANITRSNDGRSISIQPLDLMMTPVLKPLS